MTASHSPVIIPSPDGTGIRTTTACSCGQHPTSGATSSRTMDTWYRRHAKANGVDVPRVLVVDTYGSGCAAEGMTRSEWRKANPDTDPITGKVNQW